jgi:hypothetical protein
MTDIDLEIQLDNNINPNIKIYLLIVLKNVVEFHHYFKFTNKGEIFSDDKEIYKNNFWKNKPDLPSYFNKMIYITIDNLCRIRVSSENNF